MKCLNCDNTDLSMIFKVEVEFPMDENGNIYINDYERYDDLFEKCVGMSMSMKDIDGKDRKDKMYRCWKCGLEWRFDK